MFVQQEKYKENKRQNRWVVVAAALLMLSACGIKPGTLAPPEGAEENTFPRTYPDPATDPAGKDRY